MTLVVCHVGWLVFWKHVLYSSDTGGDDEAADPVCMSSSADKLDCGVLVATSEQFVRSR